MIEKAIEVKDLEKNYKDFHLNNCNFSLPSGYIMGLVGPNGSGKTTTIKLILDLVKRNEGQIEIFGKDNIQYKSQILQEIGVVFDTHCFMGEWNYNDINKIYKWFYPKWNSQKFDNYIKRFDLGNNKMVKEMSKGMQMKLMIACALSYDAKLLILDEPTSGLDPVARDELLEILGRYVEDGNHSVLFSTHITEDLEKIADYLTFIFKGNIIFTGEKEEFLVKYLKIKGFPDELDANMKKRIIGYRKYDEGFEGMINLCDKEIFKNLHTEKTTIDDVIVFMGRKNESYI